MMIFFKFFLKVFGGHTCSFLGPLVSLFWISGDICSGGSKPEWVLPYSLFAEVNVMYIP